MFVQYTQAVPLLEYRREWRFCRRVQQAGCWTDLHARAGLGQPKAGSKLGWGFLGLGSDGGQQGKAMKKEVAPVRGALGPW